MTAFSKGDRVRKSTVEHWVVGLDFMDHGEKYAKKGAVGTITDVEGPELFWVEWDEGTPCRIHERNLAPEFVVGQKVSGDDYPRLPIGSVVFDEPAAEDTVASVPVMKIGGDTWTNQGWPGVFTNAEMADDVRTLTRLGDGVADVGIVEPERDFLCCAAPSHIHGTIVTPTGERVEGTLTVPAVEPLRKDEWVQVWARVEEPKPDFDGDIELRLDRTNVMASGERWSAVWARPDAIVRPNAGQVPPWVKPAQCTSLKDMSDSVRIQCAKDADVLAHMHRTVYAGVEVRWPDEEAYGRVEVSS